MTTPLNDVKDLAARLFNVGPDCIKSSDAETASIEISGTCHTVNDPNIDRDNIAAFKALASLDGNPLSLSARDIGALQDPKALASIITSDASFKVIMLKGALEMGQKEVRPDEGHGRPRGIPPLAYKRILFYFQHALKRLGYFKGEPNGIYGPATAKAIAAFQKNEGIQGGDNGKLLGPNTAMAIVDTLIQYPNYRPRKAPDKALLANLQKLKTDLPTKGIYFESLESYQQKIIVDACRFLEWGSTDFYSCFSSLHDHYYDYSDGTVNLTLIGPRVVEWLIDRVQSGR